MAIVELFLFTNEHPRIYLRRSGWKNVRLQRLVT
jgi:hypothetical protein